jgi:hypothetical protein
MDDSGKRPKEWVTLKQAKVQSLSEPLRIRSVMSIRRLRRHHPNAEGEWWMVNAQRRVLYDLNHFRHLDRFSQAPGVVDASTIRRHPAIVLSEYNSGLGSSAASDSTTKPRRLESMRDYKARLKVERAAREAQKKLPKDVHTLDRVVDDNLGAVHHLRRNAESLSERRAAAYYKLSNAKRLERWRKQGVGPVYETRGSRIFYLIRDLERWAKLNQHLLADPSQADRISVMLGFGSLNRDSLERRPTLMGVATVRRGGVAVPLPLQNAVACQPSRWNAAGAKVMRLEDYLLALAVVRSSPSGDQPFVREVERTTLAWLARQLPDEASRLQPSLTEWAEWLSGFHGSQERERRLDEAWKDA